MTMQSEKIQSLNRRPARPKTSARKAQRIATPIPAKAAIQRAGLRAELPPAAKARAARWRALPVTERARILNEFYRLKLERPLSDLIIEQRR